MSARSIDDVSLPHDAVSAIKRYPDTAQELPAFPADWVAGDLDASQAAINLFHQAGVIRKLDTERVNGNTRSVWRTRDGLQVWLDRHFEDDETTTPCGRTGVKNLGDGEYTCSHDGCECRFDRDTAEKVVYA